MTTDLHAHWTHSTDEARYRRLLALIFIDDDDAGAANPGARHNSPQEGHHERTHAA